VEKQLNTKTKKNIILSVEHWVGEGRIFNMTSNLLDARLLGIFRNYFYVDPLQQAYVSTALNTNLGKPEYIFDQDNQVIHIVTGGDAILSLKLGWGSFELSRLPYKHIDGIAKLISIPYYLRVLGIRDQVNFDSDFSLNQDLIKQRLQLNTEQSKEWLKLIKYKNITKG
jgi:hypothetical protein